MINDASGWKKKKNKEEKYVDVSQFAVVLFLLTASSASPLKVIRSPCLMPLVMKTSSVFFSLHCARRGRDTAGGTERGQRWRQKRTNKCHTMHDKSHAIASHPHTACYARCVDGRSSLHGRWCIGRPRRSANPYRRMRCIWPSLVAPCRVRLGGASCARPGRGMHRRWTQHRSCRRDLCTEQGKHSQDVTMRHRNTLLAYSPCCSYAAMHCARLLIVDLTCAHSTFLVSLSFLEVPL